MAKLNKRQLAIIQDIKESPKTAGFLEAYHKISRGTLTRDLRAIRATGIEYEGKKESDQSYTYCIEGPIATSEKNLSEYLEGLTPEQRVDVSDIIGGTTPSQKKDILLPYGKNHVRFGALSDTHITSTFTNLDCLEYLCKGFQDSGAEFIVHSGDFTDGENMHRGQQNHLRVHGVMRVLDMIANEFPNVGIPTYFITGNHDATFYKQNGVELGVLIEKYREDLHYIGEHKTEMGFEGNLNLGPKKKTVVKLFHPGKGTAYAQSYQPQKIIEGFKGDEKPNVVLVGHYHKMDYLFTRNVHSFQVGTTEDQSEWMRTKGIHAHVGGILIDLFMKDDGSVDRLSYEMVRRGW